MTEHIMLSREAALQIAASLTSAAKAIDNELNRRDAHAVAAADTNRVFKPAAMAQPRKVFAFGPASLAEQKGVKPELLQVANLAITLSTQDFCFFDGVRSYKEQTRNVQRGVSSTMNSKHLPQADGFSHAMDLVPWVDGKPVWEWTRIYPIVFAVDQAATQLGCAQNIRWGGAWDRRLSDFGGTVEAYKRECEAYAARNPGKDFLDGPHFEWRA